jgi:tRNA dimethylallyltransferase
VSAPRALALVGPTGSGKTALSLQVARRLDGEVISMDSRSVYRGMDVGTAKPTAAEREEVPHWGLDLVEPSERFGAGRWARFARGAIDSIRSRGRVPLLVGGTGFFLRALTHPIFREPELDPVRRAALHEELRAAGDDELLRRLQEVDPESAERLRTWGGRQRLVRALEVAALTGRTLPWWQRSAGPEAPPVTVLPFVLEVPRELLYERIDARVREMVEAGLLDEVRRLVERHGADAPGLNAHGYAEVIPFLRGEIGLEEALGLVSRHTKAYTRRQLTWYRRQLPEGAVRLDATLERDRLAGDVVKAWRAATEAPPAP